MLIKDCTFSNSNAVTFDARSDYAPYRIAGEYAMANAKRQMLNARPSFCKCCGAPPEKDDLACSWCKTSYFKHG